MLQNPVANMSASQARADASRLETSPLLVVISSMQDTEKDWMNAGQAVAAVLLRTTAMGVSSSFMNQAIQVPELREGKIREVLTCDCYPQLLLRFGYAPAALATPRRSVDEVVQDVNVGPIVCS